MGKMYTLKPNESINDHVKESMSIINNIVEMSIGCMRDLANPREGTFVDMIFNEFMRSLEHIRESIEMLDELCDELEEDKDEVRREYEEKVVKFFNRVMNADPTDELTEDLEHFRTLAASRNEELEKERERSNQLEKELSRLKAQYGETQKVLSGKSRLLEMAKGFLRQRREQISRLEEELRQNLLVRTAQKKVIDEKERHICDLHHELWELQEQVEYWEDLAKKYADPDGCKPNNPCNFCGNCKHFVTHPNDIATCNNKWASPYIVDPDDASCPHFESNQVDRDKPDQPCCKACNRDDCDDCTLCPF